MKYILKKTTVLLLLFISLFLLSSCTENNGNSKTEEEIDYSINMKTDFQINDTLPEGENKKTKIIILLGQSNASGCSLVEYLKENSSKNDFARYQNGYSNILINYSIDNMHFTSNGEFKKTDLTCGCGNGFFGPEVGMADLLSKQYLDEKIFILKFTMSGYSLNHHWLNKRARGDIYNACIKFLKVYLDYLLEKEYDATVDAICWMQGESDTTYEKANLYLDNQIAFVSYLREDLKEYQNENGIYFIDAGISSSPYCLPAYKEINNAKVEFSKLSPLNKYFSTIDNGLTTLYEPSYEPDLGHYDALSEIKLGNLFAQEIIKIYNNN